MLTIMIGIAVLIVLVLAVVHLSLDKGESNTEDSGKGRIHVSGVYSVIRKSPRAELAALRPNKDEMKKYLEGVSEDAFGAQIQSSDRTALLRHWRAQTEMNLRGIEAGDKSGIAFYYYDYPRECPICDQFIAKGNFVTREEIYNNPRIIPPFHLGCACVLAAHLGSEKTMKETALAGMVPFFDGEAPPPLPEWSAVASLSARAGGKC